MHDKGKLILVIDDETKIVRVVVSIQDLSEKKNLYITKFCLNSFFRIDFQNKATF